MPTWHMPHSSPRCHQWHYLSHALECQDPMQKGTPWAVKWRQQTPGRDYFDSLGERQVHDMGRDDFRHVGELPFGKNVIGGRSSCGSSCVTEDQEIRWSSLPWLLPGRHWNPGAHQRGGTAISLGTGKESLPFIRWPSWNSVSIPAYLSCPTTLECHCFPWYLFRPVARNFS